MLVTLWFACVSFFKLTSDYKLQFCEVTSSFSGNNPLIPSCVAQPQVRQETFNHPVPELGVALESTFELIICVRVRMKSAVIQINTPQWLHGHQIDVQPVRGRINWTQNRQCDVRVFVCLVLLLSVVHIEQRSSCRSQNEKIKSALINIFEKLSSKTRRNWLKT